MGTKRERQGKEGVLKNEMVGKEKIKSKIIRINK